jgi:Protein of unknown function (DUF3137).
MPNNLSFISFHLPTTASLETSFSNSDISVYYVLFGFLFLCVLLFAILFSAISRARLRRTGDEIERQRKAELRGEQKWRRQYARGEQQQPAAAPPISDDEMFRRMADTRKKANSSIRLLALLMPVAIILCFFILPSDSVGISISFILFAFVTLIVVVASHYKKNNNVLYKEHVVRNELARHFDYLQYSPFSGFLPERVSATGLITSGEVFDSADYVSAKHLGVNFEQAEVYTYTRHNESTITHFRGRWIILQLSKRIDYPLYVYDRWFPVFVTESPISHTYQQIETENVAFNNKYKIFAADGHSAFYMLTPQVMSNLLKITAYMSQGTLLPLAFYAFQNEVHIAVHSAEDAFEMTGRDPLDRRHFTMKIAHEVQLITDVINIFNAFF